MNKYYLLPLSTAVIVLSACSSSPSDAEIKKAAIAEYTTACKLISVENYQKVNGVAGSDGRSYQEQVKFTLKVEPFPEAQAILNNGETKKENAVKAVEEAEMQMNSLKGVPGFDPRVIAAGDALTRARAKAYGAPPIDYGNEFDKICPSIDPKVRAYIINGYGEKAEYFVGGFKEEFTKTFNMVKSDNGWIDGR